MPGINLPGVFRWGGRGVASHESWLYCQHWCWYQLLPKATWGTKPYGHPVWRWVWVWYWVNNARQNKLIKRILCFSIASASFTCYPFTCNMCCWPRLYIHLILSARTFNFGSVFATVCSSWVWINSYTSGRSLLNPEGDESKQYIRLANMMMSRNLVLA